MLCMTLAALMYIKCLWSLGGLALGGTTRTGVRHVSTTTEIAMLPAALLPSCFTHIKLE